MSGSALPFMARNSLGVDGGVLKTSFSAPGLCMLVGVRWMAATDMWLSRWVVAGTGLITLAPNGHLVSYTLSLHLYPSSSNPQQTTGTASPARSCLYIFQSAAPAAHLLVVDWLAARFQPFNQSLFLPTFTFNHCIPVTAAEARAYWTMNGLLWALDSPTDRDRLPAGLNLLRFHRRPPPCARIAPSSLHMFG